MLRRFRLFFQLTGLLALAWLWPSLGGGVDALLPMRKLAVAVLFFMAGVSLRPRDVARSAGKVRCHIVIHAALFGLFPALVAGTHFPFDRMAGGQITLGLYALSALPATVSSCVVFTTLAYGSSGIALFNAVLSNLIGLFVSPLLFLLFLQAGEVSIVLNKSAIVIKMALLVVAPFVFGQMFPRRGRAWFRRRPRVCRTVNVAAILAIVYFSFCDLFLRSGTALAARPVVFLCFYLALLNLAMLGLLKLLAGLLRFSSPDRIAVMFTGSQKTLAMGMPLIIAFAESDPSLSAGLMALPIIVYHPLQLIIASFARDWVAGPDTFEGN